MEPTMKVADYKELRVYKLAFESAMQVFALSRQWPSEEKYSLTDQIRRSSRSVCTNIAEAWRKRRYEAAFISKLSDSDGEAAETEVHLTFALRCGYLAADSHAKLLDHYDHICRQLTKMMDDAASWCGTGCELREIGPEYLVERPPTVERESVKDPLRRSDTPHAPNAPRSDAPRSPRSPRS
jgi:four helix bundle protein